MTVEIMKNRKVAYLSITSSWHMTKHSGKEKLLADIRKNFRKLELELDTLPPVLVNDKSIRAHADGLLVNACELVAHAAGWTELASKWINRVQMGESLNQPEEGYSWDEPDGLSQSYYDEYRMTSFKEVRARFSKSNALLIERITDSEDAILFGTPLHANQMMDEILRCYIFDLYAQDHFRIRVWKKGLGWI